MCVYDEEGAEKSPWRKRRDEEIERQKREQLPTVEIDIPTWPGDEKTPTEPIPVPERRPVPGVWAA